MCEHLEQVQNIVQCVASFYLSSQLLKDIFVCKYICRFRSDVDSGLVEIVSPSYGYYPDLDAVPLTFGDSRERVK